jgi:MoaA/NifB/PqqE/SkfB family radical SAM enzyme
MIDQSNYETVNKSWCRVKSLVLVVTRRCNQRCTYCLVAKNGWPDMSLVTARLALRAFVDRFGGGQMKFFGGEPLLSWPVVQAVLDEAEHEPSISKITLCTNGALLDERLLDALERHPKLWLVLSFDGRPEDHRSSRRALQAEVDPLVRINALLPRLRGFPRLMLTQVVAPELAERAAGNFRYLLALGFRRFNLLPAGWVPWTREQLAALRISLAEVAAVVCAEWHAGRSLYLRNLFTRSPQPTFASGVVVDVDGRVFPSDCVLADLDEATRAELCCGSVESPPSEEELLRRAVLVPAILERCWPREVVESTRAANALLDAFCRSLLREYLATHRPLSAAPG